MSTCEMPGTVNNELPQNTHTHTHNHRVKVHACKLCHPNHREDCLVIQKHI